jgi:hypothetical protein
MSYDTKNDDRKLKGKSLRGFTGDVAEPNKDRQARE